ncbi:hypothetical protein [Microbispora sp. NPDC049125]|uniref:phage distal tail protein n=1 Tax=Microbispora sp. NPDC049125 TaxID=3154929 RepID=UPI00346632A2
MSFPLTTPVYTLGTWEGNVTDDYGVDWIVETEDGWSSSPPIRAQVEARSNADGGWGGPGFYDSRVVTLSGHAIAPDRMTMLAAKDRIKSAISPRSPVQLQVAEAHLTRVASVRLTDQIDLADVNSFAFTWAFTLTAVDPRRYDANPVTVTATLPVGLTAGRTYSRTHPVVYGGVTPGGGGSVYIQNDGDYDETPAVITFVGPLVTPRVEHPQSGRSLTFDVTLDYDDTLIVDLKAKTALLNGAVNQAYTITAGSAWFMLTPGLNEFAFRGTAGTAPPDITPTPVPQMTVTAASAWT